LKKDKKKDYRLRVGNLVFAPVRQSQLGINLSIVYLKTFKECDCKDGYVSDIVVTLRDMAGPSVVKAYPCDENGNKLRYVSLVYNGQVYWKEYEDNKPYYIKPGDTVYIKVEFNENVRFSDDKTPMETSLQDCSYELPDGVSETSEPVTAYYVTNVPTMPYDGTLESYTFYPWDTTTSYTFKYMDPAGNVGSVTADLEEAGIRLVPSAGPAQDDAAPEYDIYIYKKLNGDRYESVGRYSGESETGLLRISSWKSVMSRNTNT